jgi:hypothetical protein
MGNTNSLLERHPQLITDKNYKETVLNYIMDNLEFNEHILIYTDDIFIDFLRYTKKNKIYTEIDSISLLTMLIVQSDIRYISRYNNYRRYMYCKGCHNFLFHASFKYKKELNYSLNLGININKNKEIELTTIH